MLAGPSARSGCSGEARASAVVRPFAVHAEIAGTLHAPNLARMAESRCARRGGTPRVCVARTACVASPSRSTFEGLRSRGCRLARLGGSPLLGAAWEGDEALVRALLAAGAEPDPTGQGEELRKAPRVRATDARRGTSL